MKVGWNKKQMILGKELSYKDFKFAFELIEVIRDSSHDDRYILKYDNDYWLYDFHEEVDFDGGEDLMYEHWFKMYSLKSAKKYSNKSVFELKFLNLPHLYTTPQGEFKINER